MDKSEQVSLFSRLLEIVIKHAIAKKNEEKSSLEKAVIPRSGSKLSS